MATAKFDAEKFTGKNDFGLWRIKMKALLTQQGLSSALKGDEGTAGSTDIKRVEMMEKAHSAIILCLGDKVLREVSKEKSAAAVWSKLESLYMTKSLANRLYIKQKLYSFRLLDEKSMDDQLEEFNKIIDDLENVEVKIENEDQAIILLNALPKTYEHLKDVMLYGRDSDLKDVQSALKAKEMQKISHVKTEPIGEGLNVKQKFVKGKFKKQGSDGKKPWQPKAKEGEEKETRTCHYCKKSGHSKKDCYAYKRKQAMKNGKHESGEPKEQCDVAALNVVDCHMEREWVLDSRCSFHMCPHKDWFCELEYSDLGSVLLGNDYVCTIKGIGWIS